MKTRNSRLDQQRLPELLAHRDALLKAPTPCLCFFVYSTDVESLSLFVVTHNERACFIDFLIATIHFTSHERQPKTKHIHPTMKTDPGADPPPAPALADPASAGPAAAGGAACSTNN